MEKTEAEKIEEIQNMSHFEMCKLWRFAESGHEYFDSSKPYSAIFMKRLFDDLGGFTPEISKELGWER
jgi:hypothetical protein